MNKVENHEWNKIGVFKCLKAFKTLIWEEIHIYEFCVYNGTRGKEVCVPYMLFLWWEQWSKGNGGRNWGFLWPGMSLTPTRSAFPLLRWFRQLRSIFGISIGLNERNWKKRWGLGFVGSDLVKNWVRYGWKKNWGRGFSRERGVAGFRIWNLNI